jgi:hypothetical protein
MAPDIIDTIDGTSHQAKLALLQKIAELAPQSANPSQLVRLAEAWAWVVQPAQAHGTGGGGTG